MQHPILPEPPAPTLPHPPAPKATSPAGVTGLIRKIELPWFILAALLLSTLLAAFQSSRQLRTDADGRFAEIALSEKRGLVRQLHDVETQLLSAKAFATALPGVDQSSWDKYTQTIVPAGVAHRGVVALELMPGNETSAPATSAAWKASPLLADALARARVSGQLVMSAPLGSIVGDSGQADSVALVLPLAPASTQTEQPGANAGAVVALVDLAAMLSTVEREQTFSLVRELYDGGKRIFPPTAPAATEASKTGMTTELPIEFGQRVLRLKISSTPQLEKTLRSEMPRAILVIGIFGTMLLGALVLFLTRLREQAETLASSMTRKLQDQTRFTEDLIEFNPNPIFRKDTEGRFVAVNQAWEELSGRKRKDVLGNTEAVLYAQGAPQAS
ncbi:MAG: PAS domain S-box protein, partial [Usitatibacteraceae bacterium]